MDACAVSPGGRGGTCVEGGGAGLFYVRWRPPVPTASGWLFKRTGTQRQQL